MIPLANIKLIKQMNNLYLFQAGDCKIWFSYETPIAYENETIIVVTNRYFSKTTQKHKMFLLSHRSMSLDAKLFDEYLIDYIRMRNK